MIIRAAVAHLLVALGVIAVMVVGSEAGAVGSGRQAGSASRTEPAEGASSMRLFEAALASSNLRLRVLTGRTFDPLDETWTRTFVPIDTLAEQVRGSTDPMVLALMIGPCDNDRLKPRPTCDAVEMARRWAAADPQNQVAWLTLSSTLRSRGDLTGSKQAFRRAAMAPRWHEYHDDGARIVLNALPAASGPDVRMAALRAAVAASVADLLPDAALDALSVHCQDERADAECRRIVDAIDRDASTVPSARTGIAIGRTIGVDPARTAARMQKLDALQMQSTAPRSKRLDDLADAMQQATEASVLQRRGALADLPTMRQRIAGNGLTSAVAAERDIGRVEALQDFRIVAPTEYAY